MFENKFPLFRLLGFQIRADVSWLFIVGLIVWSLATGVFPSYFPDLPPVTYWSMGVVGALGLFASIVLHEVAHAVVARAYGIRIKGITLFIFGGVAEMENEPPSAKSEFLLAIAGPIMSGFLALLFYGLATLGENIGIDVSGTGVARYLAVINAILALFNLVPGFPLDGGRALRAALWYWRGDMIWATRIASNTGSVFGLLMMGYGLVMAMQGDLIQGIWWGMIGLFLRNAASGSYQSLVAKRVMAGEIVGRFMTPRPITVAPDATLDDVVENIIYPYHHKFFPVTAGDRVVGCITTMQIKMVPREDWRIVRIEQIMSACQNNTVTPETQALDALALMNKIGVSRLMVVEDKRLVGILTLKDLLAFLSLKMELEGPGEE